MKKKERDDGNKTPHSVTRSAADEMMTTTTGIDYGDDSNKTQRAKDTAKKAEDLNEKKQTNKFMTEKMEDWCHIKKVNQEKTFVISFLSWSSLY